MNQLVKTVSVFVFKDQNTLIWQNNVPLIQDLFFLIYSYL